MLAALEIIRECSQWFPLLTNKIGLYRVCLVSSPNKKSISQSNKMETPGTASPYHKSLVFSIEMCSVAEHSIDRTEREKYSYVSNQ